LLSRNPFIVPSDRAIPNTVVIDEMFPKLKTKNEGEISTSTP
jgi:hypothetical protein